MQREYTQKTQVGDNWTDKPVVNREECSPKRDKTDIQYQTDELINHADQLEKMIISLSDRLKPVMSPNCLIKGSGEPCDKKMEEISPLASSIRIVNVSLNNSTLELNEIFSRLQV